LGSMDHVEPVFSCLLFFIYMSLVIDFSLFSFFFLGFCLIRNKFIANYNKGMIAFVDEYWKIIHRAAGWDALRYWLLMLFSNHFLTGHDVAQVLAHYEDLVGMAFW